MSVVTPEDIRIIPVRYAIGKRPLSLLLGWGELTYTRLLDGNTPTPQHAAELRRLLDDPAAFARLLETGRSRITETAYNRSFRAVDALLENEGGALKATRIYAVADRICKLAGGDITPNALQRLVYYAQGMGFALLDKSLFDELPRASATGPCYDRIFEGYTFDEIQRVAEDDASDDVQILTPREIEAIDLSYQRYGDHSSQVLSSMSCNEAPWKKARKRAGVEVGAECAEFITAKSMRKYFSKSV